MLDASGAATANRQGERATALVIGRAVRKIHNGARAGASAQSQRGGAIVSGEFQYACTLDELKRKGRLVMHGSHRPVLLILDRDRVRALDNRCPHMGFPLERGSVADGILTCHWHHARFDLASGCTFDLWADDVPTCPVEVRGAEIWVKPEFGHEEPAAYWRLRLEDGMAHNLGLVIAKAVQGRLAAGMQPLDIVRQAALFGAQNLDGWTAGMTILTAMGSLIAALPKHEACLALLHGVRHVAADCEGAVAPRKRSPLASRPDPDALKRWLRRWSAARHGEAAQRTVLTAIAAGALLPTVVGPRVAPRGADEATEWRQPADLLARCEHAATQMAQFASSGEAGSWSRHVELAHALLGEDANAVLAAVCAAARDGASCEDLGRSLSYAAALRVARFGTANEHGDWESAHHVFTYCNAVHQGLKRISADRGLAGHRNDLLRAVLHGAMAIYLIRYLNVPPARLPGEDGDASDDLPATAEDIRAALLDAFDRQHQVEIAGRLVARHLALEHPPELIISALAHALLREDAGFHAYQMLEAAVRQFREWGNTRQGRHILVAVARYLAAHSPTERAWLQTADIAERLSRGDQLHENA